MKLHAAYAAVIVGLPSALHISSYEVWTERLSRIGEAKPADAVSTSPPQPRPLQHRGFRTHELPEATDVAVRREGYGGFGQRGGSQWHLDMHYLR